MFVNVLFDIKNIDIILDLPMGTVRLSNGALKFISMNDPWSSLDNDNNWNTGSIIFHKIQITEKLLRQKRKRFAFYVKKELDSFYDNMYDVSMHGQYIRYHLFQARCLDGNTNYPPDTRI